MYFWSWAVSVNNIIYVYLMLLPRRSSALCCWHGGSNIFSPVTLFKRAVSSCTASRCGSGAAAVSSNSPGKQLCIRSFFANSTNACAWLRGSNFFSPANAFDICICSCKEELQQCMSAAVQSELTSTYMFSWYCFTQDRTLFAASMVVPTFFLQPHFWDVWFLLAL